MPQITNSTAPPASGIRDIGLSGGLTNCGPTEKSSKQVRVRGWRVRGTTTVSYESHEGNHSCEIIIATYAHPRLFNFHFIRYEVVIENHYPETKKSPNAGGRGSGLMTSPHHNRSDPLAQLLSRVVSARSW